MRERRKYTAEFKREAVELSRVSDKTVAQIAREVRDTAEVVVLVAVREGEDEGGGSSRAGEATSAGSRERPLEAQGGAARTRAGDPPKSLGHFLEGTMSRFTFIEAQRGAVSDPGVV